MKKQFFSYILSLTLFLSCIGFRAVAQKIQAEAKLQQYTIRIGDQTRLFLIVHQTAKEHVNFPKLVDTVTGKVQIVSANKPDTSSDKNDKNNLTITQTYTITSFDAGTYTIPSFAFGASSGVAKSNELTLQVETVKVDTTKAIYDIKQPLAVTYTFLDWLRDNWIWVAAVVLVLLFAGGLIYYLRKRPKAKPVVKVVKPRFPAHVTALNKLKELRDKKLWQQDQVKQYYIELSDVIREYLEQRFVIKTHEKTTEEIFASLKYIDISTENKNMLLQILVLADLVKFAKERPLPADNDQSMDSAIAFVERTLLVEQLIKPEGGTQNV